MKGRGELRAKSPPGYGDLHGKQRQQAKLLLVEREIALLQDELKSLEGVQPSSRCCKELNEYVATKQDPFLAINQESNKSNCCWRRSSGCCKSHKAHNQQEEDRRCCCCCCSVENCCVKCRGTQGCSCFGLNCCSIKLSCSSNCCSKPKVCSNCCVPRCCCACASCCC